MVSVTVIVVNTPLLLFTIFNGMLVVGGDSLLNPAAEGVINCVIPPVEIISAITPDPGVGLVVIVLLASAVRAATLLYTVTHAADDTCMLYKL